MILSEQLAAAGLSMADIEKLSKGVITENKLKKHSTGMTTLSAEDRQTLNRIIAEYRMLMGKVKFVVFEAVGRPVG
jgi:hypothetical protein